VENSPVFSLLGTQRAGTVDSTFWREFFDQAAAFDNEALMKEQRLEFATNS